MTEPDETIKLENSNEDASMEREAELSPRTIAHEQEGKNLPVDSAITEDGDKALGGESGGHSEHQER